MSPRGVAIPQPRGARTPPAAKQPRTKKDEKRQRETRGSKRAEFAAKRRAAADRRHHGHGPWAGVFSQTAPRVRLECFASARPRPKKPDGLFEGKGAVSVSWGTLSFKDSKNSIIQKIC